MSDAIQAYLDAGHAGVWHVAFRALPRRRSTGVREPVGYWAGLEDVALTVGAETWAFSPAGEALTFEPAPSSIGTQVRTARVTLFGLAPGAQDTYRAYDSTQARADVLSVVMTPGGVVVGSRRLFRGTVDRTDLDIGAEDGGATLTIDLASRMMPGTRVIESKKSHASYHLRSNDTAMAYAALKNVESDTWRKT